MSTGSGPQHSSPGPAVESEHGESAEISATRPLVSHALGNCADLQSVARDPAWRAHGPALGPGDAHVTSDVVRALRSALRLLGYLPQSAPDPASWAAGDDTSQAVEHYQLMRGPAWTRAHPDIGPGTPSRVDFSTLLMLDRDAQAAEATPAADPTSSGAPARTSEWTNGAGRLYTRQGYFYRFTSATTVTNQENRPQFVHAQPETVEYTGPGAYAHCRVHPVLTDPLAALMGALIQEGQRINDESMKQARIGSAWRSISQDGRLYLQELRSQMASDARFRGLTFPASLEAEAQGNLAGSALDTFVADLGAAPGWNPALAHQLVTVAGGFKAPAGTSTHESGLVVDIDFPYATSATNVVWHRMNRDRNGDARLAAAGIWLAQHSREHHFSSYDTHHEIWHMEFLEWHGTAAEPSSGAAP